MKKKRWVLPSYFLIMIEYFQNILQPHRRTLPAGRRFAVKKQFVGILMIISLFLLTGWNHTVSGQDLASGSGTGPVVLKPQQVTASSELEPYHSSIPPYPLYTYYASYVDDWDPDTAWNEGADGAGTGEYLELVYPEGTVLMGMLVYPGFYSTEELFYQNNAPTSLRISCGDMSAEVSLEPYSNQWQNDFQGMYMDLETPIICSGPVRVTIENIRPGNTYNDACISELHFYGYKAVETGSQEKQAEPADDGPEPAEPINAGPEPAPASDISAAQPGDLVPFGADQSDGGASPLLWQVLDKTEDSLLLITQYVLPAPKYNDTNHPLWGPSAMRAWLNGDFYQQTFNDEEKSRILPTDITYKTMYTEDGTWDEETVTDHVFLLNAEQAGQYFADNESRRATFSWNAGETVPWWLIGIGFEFQGAAEITALGEIDSYGTSVENLLGVRPVIRVRISDDAGTADNPNIPDSTGDFGTAENTADPGAADSTDNAAGAALSEEDMKQLFTNAVPDHLLYFIYDDYDYNGTFEAFAVIEQPDNPMYAIAYFIADDGSITRMTQDGELWGYEFQDNTNVRQKYMADTGTQKFYIWENYAGGSGSQSKLFGVRGGVPYEPQISSNVQAFRQEDGQFVSDENDFSQGYHDFIRATYTFDPNTGEFLRN